MRHLLKRNSTRKFSVPKFRCGIQPFRNVSKEVIKTMEKEYDKLGDAYSPSLLKKYLTDVMFERYKKVETFDFKCNLMDCIQSGFKHHDSLIGVYAADHDSFKLFAPLFCKVIAEVHDLKKPPEQPPTDYGKLETFENIDPRMNFIQSTRMRVERNLVGYPFTPCMSEAEYKKMENEVRASLSTLKGELKGSFHRYANMLASARERLKEDHVIKDPSRFSIGANICRYLPTGRAIYYTLDKTFSVWLNYEDHLRIVSKQQGADFYQVYSRLIKGIEAIDALHTPYRDPCLGYLTCCPTMLGSSIRASVLIKLHKLPVHKKLFQQLLDKYQLQVRGTYGEYTPVVNHIYDISNRSSLNISEFQAVKSVYDGILEIIRMEKCTKVAPVTLL